MFYGATAFNRNLSAWNVSGVIKMYGMFSDAITFNQDLSGWDMSRVSNVGMMFFYAISFNQNLSGWDVSRVTDMGGMFHNAILFNQDLSGWDVSSVLTMSNMFNWARDFNQDLSGWDVSKVTYMSDMFQGATALAATLQRTMHVSSFFEGVYLDMPREKRRQAFAGVFRWQRRRAFLLFLVNHGYLYSASAPSNYKDPGATKPSSEVVPCDAIFDVEDVYRYICQFL